MGRYSTFNYKAAFVERAKELAKAKRDRRCVRRLELVARGGFRQH